MIDFNNIKSAEIKNFKGGINSVFVKKFEDETCRIMHITIKPNCSIGVHAHETSLEILYVLDGEGKVIIDGADEKLFKGVCHYCKKGQSHTVINDGISDLVFFAIVVGNLW